MTEMCISCAVKQMKARTDHSEALYANRKVVRTLEEQNRGFIGRRCQICGGEDVCGNAVSRLRLMCGYGSAYDGERVELTLCGSCADKIYTLINIEKE